LTIIAYRYGVLAADTECHNVDTIVGHRTKIMRINGGRVGMTGYLPLGLAIIDWLKAGQKGPMPDNPASPDDSCAVLWIPDRGGVYLAEFGFVTPQPRAPYYAYGIGSDIALGAFWHGATAPEAVRAAIAHHAKCGGRVKVLDK
jgi:hypothetical protein